MPLQFQPLTPKEFFASCNKDYAESKISELEEFKEKVAQYLESLEKHKGQNEKAIVANVLAPFLQGLGFHTQAAFKQKGNSEIDLALLKDSQVEILIEAKTQKNKTEMFSAENPNCKALHECILYYLRERENNTRLKYILITDFYQFYLFRAKEFERYFYKNKKIQDAYKSLNKKDLLENQKDFYAELAKILSKEFQGNLEGDLFNTSLQGTHFDLRNDKHFKQSYAILNKEFLHDEFHRDSNALNPKFYYELLHILGLKEIETKGKILIQIDETQKNSFAKHIADKLKNNNKPSDFETTMSHIIVWLNRILFLKLIEANLLHFNDFDKNLRFLTSTKITSFSILAHLFFEVLARDYAERKQDKGFNFLPYLNSSLFIRDEKEICDLNALDDTLEILPFATTQTEYKKGKSVRFLTYLFDFLECFDFGKSQDSNLSHKLINSSVLGAMFEKLNGYQEGSFYTPNFITSYMCKESLQKIVLDRFNTAFSWSAKDLESLRKQIDRNFDKESKFKKLLESIRICDPSVGSGHFLVSALNEMIAIYHKLGLLGFGYKDLQIKDDEIHLTTKEGEKFAYKRLQDSNHTIQIALFTLKKSIIENNLFGVDINPNSCNIARLRLWIELLKNAYYLNFSKDKDSKIHKLQTLPNIDINIKCGNSLISYMGIDDKLLLNTTEQIKRYQKLEVDYFNGFYQDKDKMIKDINRVKQDLLNQHFETKFKEQLEKLAKECEKYSKSYGDYAKDSLEEHYKFIKNHISISGLFAPNLDDEMQNKAQKALQTLKNEHDKIFNLSKNFEWRIEFSKLLNAGLTKEQITHNNKQKQKGDFKDLYKDESGKFLGFDLVIGNPPYIKEVDNKRLFDGTRHLRTYQDKMDIWYHFVGRGFDIVKNQGIVTFIATQNWTTNTGAKNLRNVILKESQILNLVDFGSYMCFDSASIQTMIMEFQKLDSTPQNYQIHYARIDSKKPTDKHRDTILAGEEFEDNIYLTPTITPLQMLDKPLTFSDSKQAEVLNKILENGKIFLKEDEVAQGIVPAIDKAFILNNISDFSKEEMRFIKTYYTGLQQKYYIEKTDKFLIYMSAKNYQQDNLDGLPNLKQHFEPYKEILQKAKIQYKTPHKPYFFLHREREERFFIEGNEKIISQVRCEIPTFVYTKENFYGSRALFFIQTSRFDMKFLTGLFNSKLIAFWLKYKGKIQGNLYKIEKEPLLNIPIPKITKSNQKIVDRIITLVDEILNLKAKDSTFDTSALESEIDKLVYKLYNLNENEINIIEDK